MLWPRDFLGSFWFSVKVLKVMKLIVGLGNPGLRYKQTKHNAGFWLIDRVAKEEKINANKRKFNALWGSGQLRRQKVILVKPLTFMNLSGKSVKSFIDYFKINLDSVLVVYDDISLKLGNIRLRADGGAGGHNGMCSVIDNLGTNKFARLRLGISTASEEKNLSNYVLSKFRKKDDQLRSQEMLQQAEETVLCWLDKGIVCAMNKFNK